MIMVAALCMLGQTSSAQVMCDNIVTVEYKDAEGKVQTLEKRSSDGPVDFSFLGSKKRWTAERRAAMSIMPPWKRTLTLMCMRVIMSATEGRGVLLAYMLT